MLHFVKRNCASQGNALLYKKVLCLILAIVLRSCWSSVDLYRTACLCQSLWRVVPTGRQLKRPPISFSSNAFESSSGSTCQTLPFPRWGFCWSITNFASRKRVKALKTLPDPCCHQNKSEKSKLRNDTNSKVATSHERINDNSANLTRNRSRQNLRSSFTTALSVVRCWSGRFHSQRSSEQASAVLRNACGR